MQIAVKRENSQLASQARFFLESLALGGLHRYDNVPDVALFSRKDRVTRGERQHIGRAVKPTKETIQGPHPLVSHQNKRNRGTLGTDLFPQLAEKRAKATTIDFQLPLEISHMKVQAFFSFLAVEAFRCQTTTPRSSAVTTG
jgi:hypothetical protein